MILLCFTILSILATSVFLWFDWFIGCFEWAWINMGLAENVYRSETKWKNAWMLRMSQFFKKQTVFSARDTLNYMCNTIWVQNRVQQISIDLFHICTACEVCTDSDNLDFFLFTKPLLNLFRCIFFSHIKSRVTLHPMLK